MRKEFQEENASIVYLKKQRIGRLKTVHDYGKWVKYIGSDELSFNTFKHMDNFNVIEF